MIRDITIGQYYPAQSPIHKLDPRVKLFATLIYIIALFSYKGIAGVLFIVAALAAVIKISKVPFKFMVKGLYNTAAFYSMLQRVFHTGRVHNLGVRYTAHF